MCGMYRLGKRRAGGPVGQGSDTIHWASWRASASFTAFGGIGTDPQTPTLPLITFWLRESTAPEATSIGRPAADDAFRQRPCLSTQCAASTTG
jgi:hypothetical protein